MFLSHMRLMTVLSRLPLYFFVIAFSCAPAWAGAVSPGSGAESPSLQCRKAVRAAERGAGIPDHLLAAIARVESGRRDPSTGDLQPWPWTIDAEGQGFLYETKAAAIASVRALQARGVRSIDVGCLQVNLAQHPEAFASLDQAFDPQANADYAARFLAQLFDRGGGWPKAAAMYHSGTPDIGADYQTRVIAAWPAEKAAQLAALGPDGLGRPGPEPAAALPGGRVAVFLPPNRTDAMRIIPLAVPGGAPDGGGRGLESYRAMPVALAARPTRSGG